MKPYNSYLRTKHTIIANKLCEASNFFKTNNKKCLLQIFQNNGYFRPTVTQLNKTIK
jgi:hypothetical protein